MSDSSGFVHLSVHTEYSLVDSVVRVKPLVKAAAQRGMPAVAMTDHMNLFAAVKFVSAAESAGVKPILGCDLVVHDPVSETDNALRLLCATNNGYRNLMQLVSRGYVHGQERGSPVIHPDWLADHADGLIALSGGHGGLISREIAAGHGERALEVARGLRDVFGDRLFLELERIQAPDEAAINDNLVDLAAMLDLGIVAGNAVRFLNHEDFDTHEVRLCIRQGRVINDPRRTKDVTGEQWLKSAGDMRELFADLPEACDNAVEIARRCNVTLSLGKSYLPDFPVPEEHDVESFLRKEAEEGLEQRLATLEAEGGKPDRTVYADRLTHELDVIIKMGFPGYFLIVADFIRWAKRNDVPVGPGRGSGAGSLVAYVLEITNVDPIPYNLLFERFLNPERVSMPDFDIDFCMDGRDRVIEYVAERYGREKVSQIITFGRMAAKAVVRDVGRVLGHPYGFVDGIAKLIPAAVDMTLSKALEESDELKARRENEEEVKYLLDTALKLEGLARNVGKHAGGVVIAPSRIDDFTPLFTEPGGGGAVTQFDWKDVEAAGLVKFDFLGLRTLTILDRAVKVLETMGTTIDLDTLPLDDGKTFELLRSGDTAAVFQLESSGMRRLMKELKPDRFEDIVALVALFRPGPLETGMAADYVARKNDPAQVRYMHPLMENSLRDTYGVIVYQEQVMAVARELAGYSLGAADQLRRAMGKKDMKKMADHRPIFVAGAVERGVDEDLAGRIFDLIAEFAKYGFNKSHSVAYALLAYQTAYLKAHYPAAFMCAVLTADMDHTEKVVPLIGECRRLELEVVPPDVNGSDYEFTASEDGCSIRYGLGAVKGVGQGAIEGILEARAAGGPFADLVDFCVRIDLKRANRRTLEALIRAGALDALGENRPSLLAALPNALAAADQHHAALEAGQNDLFGGGGAAESHVPAIEIPVLRDWDDGERLQGEKQTLGLYLTGHPINGYRGLLQGLTSGTIAEAKERADPQARRRGGEQLRIAGLVVDVMQRAGRAIVRLDDGTGQLECTLFSEKAEQFRHLLHEDRLLVAVGSLSFDSYSEDFRMNPKELLDLDDALSRYARGLRLTWKTSPQTQFDRLEACLSANRVEEGARIRVAYLNGRAQAELNFADDWQVAISHQLVRDLSDLCGENGVEVRYRQDSTSAA
ncbi:DNA polymerase III subunit alpha [uncultured Abyssibacter sp.]|uniref:DNA polymerase III subunit alpha n=1 Tax=uncultured Abyssibacter sp. TaxID=2320202 RepID=UPI0032B1A316